MLIKSYIILGARHSATLVFENNVALCWTFGVIFPICTANKYVGKEIRICVFWKIVLINKLTVSLMFSQVHAFPKC